MAANQGWFGEWFAGGWFPPVWFAPADESHLLDEERASTGGGPDASDSGRGRGRGRQHPGGREDAEERARREADELDEESFQAAKASHGQRIYSDSQKNLNRPQESIEAPAAIEQAPALDQQAAAALDSALEAIERQRIEQQNEVAKALILLVAEI